MLSREHLECYCPSTGLKKFRTVQQVTSIPTAAALMIPKAAQPRYPSSGEFTRFPITVGLLVRRIISRIRGGETRPLITADHNSIFTARNPTTRAFLNEGRENHSIHLHYLALTSGREADKVINYFNAAK